MENITDLLPTGKQQTCVTCGILFYQKQKFGRSKYCGPLCFGIFKNKTAKERRESDLRLGMKGGKPVHVYSYERYRASAIKRNKSFNLTIDQFMELWQKPCYYCKSKIQFIGVDRVDNSIGYEIGNIVPCCTNCNLMKRHMTAVDYINHCIRVSENNTLIIPDF